MDSDLEEAMDVDDPEPMDDLDLIHAGTQRGEGDRGYASGNDDNDGNQQENGGYNGAEEAATGDADGEKKEIKKKRVILNPQPKLNYHTLTGKRGLCAMKEIFSDIQLKGKGHERSDLNKIMSKLEYWTHRLFPRYSFDEVLARVEKLGNKRPVQVYVKRMRLGMDDLLNPISNEFVEEEPASPPPEQSLDDAFDSLFPSEPVVPATTPKPTVEITAEQKERMERNRQLALEKRLARIEAQKEEERRKASENAAGSSGTSGAEPSTSTSMPENSSEPEFVEENPDIGIRRDNLFECSQEVSSISKLPRHIPEVSTVNLNDSSVSKQPKHCDSISEPSGHTPEVSTVNLNDSSVSEQPKHCDSISEPSGHTPEVSTVNLNDSSVSEQPKHCDSISEPSGHTPEVSTVNLNDSFEGSSDKIASKQPKHHDNISQLSGHTPEVSTVNLNDNFEDSSEKTASEQPKHSDSVSDELGQTASLSRFDEVPMPEPTGEDMDTLPEGTIGISASETVQAVSQGSEDT